MPLAIVIFLSVLLTAATVRADGGTLRLSQTVRDLRVTVFTNPIPPRAGPIDVSVLVQNGTGDVETAVRVKVVAFKKGSPSKRISQTASNDAATNKLLQAAILDLPEPGIWEIHVRIADSEVTFDMEVAEAMPAWWHLGGWIAWPLVAVVLFMLHRRLAEFRKRREIDFPPHKRELESRNSLGKL